jgi:hypothetical protein
MKTAPALRALTAGLLCCAAVHAWAGPASPCGPSGCGATGVDPAVLREAARPAAASRLAPAANKGSLAVGARDDSWERRLGGRPGQEDYNCALSFGIGGSLGKDGFLGTRVLGRSQVWRDGAAEARPRPPN